MSMSEKAARRYLNDRFYLDEMEKDIVDAMVHNLVVQKHKPWCRTHLAEAMLNYGADCTCGLRAVEEMVRVKWDEGPEAVAVYLNGQMDWTEAK